MTDEKSLNTWISQYKDTPLSVDIPNEMEDIKNCLMVTDVYTCVNVCVCVCVCVCVYWISGTCIIYQ